MSQSSAAHLAITLSLLTLLLAVVVLLVMNAAARRWKAAEASRIATGRMIARCVEAALARDDDPQLQATSLTTIGGMLRAGFGYDEGEQPWGT